MKNKFTIIFTVFFMFILLNPSAEEKSVWEGTASGDYVIYKDLSWKEPAWVGFLYYNDNTIGTFLYTSNGKTFAKVLFSGEILDGEFVITGQNNISGRITDPNYTYAINYLMDILPKFFSWKNTSLKESLVVKKGSKTVNEEQFGGESEVSFISYIPLFHIHSILNHNNETALELAEMGRVKNDDKTFFTFKPMEAKEALSSRFELKYDVLKEERKIDGVRLFLDSQWKQIADNSFLMGNEAFLNVNTVDLKPLPDIKGREIDFLVSYFSSSGESSKVLVKNTNITGSKQKFKLINDVYDIETKGIKRDIKLIIQRENARYTVVSLTVDKASYEKYKEYFDGLF